MRRAPYAICASQPNQSNFLLNLDVLMLVNQDGWETSFYFENKNDFCCISQSNALITITSVVG